MVSDDSGKWRVEETCSMEGKDVEGLQVTSDLFDHIQMAFENKAKPAMDYDESNDDTMTDVVPTWPIQDYLVPALHSLESDMHNRMHHTKISLF